MNSGTSFLLMKRALLITASMLALSMPLAAHAVIDVGGVKIEESMKVGNAQLKLNGAGVRKKVFVSVYVAALYLTEKKNTPADVMALAGPKRIQLTMLRDVTSDTMGQSFMDGLNHNSTKVEKTKIVNQMQKFGEMFASIPELKKGDVVAVEWVPNVGSLTTLNGKPTAEPFPDVAFFNALLRIWIGDNPAYAPLKNQMLGVSEKAVTENRKEN